MPLLRAIAAALIVLGCSAFSQMCLITTMAAERAVDCCQHEEPAKDAGEKECAQCMTLESGVDRVAPISVAVTEPAAVVDAVLSALVALAMEQAGVGLELDTSQPAAVTPLWQFVARTAAPVRGPSLIA